jgi:hypothetical protein
VVVLNEPFLDLDKHESPINQQLIPAVCNLMLLAHLRNDFPLLIIIVINIWRHNRDLLIPLSIFNLVDSGNLDIFSIINFEDLMFPALDEIDNEDTSNYQNEDDVAELVDYSVAFLLRIHYLHLHVIITLSLR